MSRSRIVPTDKNSNRVSAATTTYGLGFGHQKGHQSLGNIPIPIKNSSASLEK